MSVSCGQRKEERATLKILSGVTDDCQEFDRRTAFITWHKSSMLQDREAERAKTLQHHFTVKTVETVKPF